MDGEQMKLRKIHIRISDADHKKIADNAKKVGLKIGPFLRMIGILGMDVVETKVVLSARAGIEATDEQSKTG